MKDVVAPTASPPRHRLRAPVLLAFLLGLALPGVIALYGIEQNREARVARERVARSHALLTGTLELENAVTMMEARHRAFLLGGERVFVERRESSLSAARAALASLEALAVEDAASRRQLGRIAEAVDARARLMRESSALVASAGLEVARANFPMLGSGSSDPLRHLLAEMRGRQQALMSARLRASERGERRLDAVLINGTAIALLLLASAALLVRRQLRRNEAIARDLDRALAQQRAMLEDGGLIIISVRPDGVIRLFNRAASQALGYAPEEVVGLQTPALLHDPDEMQRRGTQLSLDLGVPIDGFEVFTARPLRGEVDRAEWTYVRKDGSRFRVELAVSAVRGDDGELHGFIGMAIDLSQRDAAEREVRELNRALAAKAEALAATNRELEGFSYSVSHDLRAPLRHIEGYAAMLQEDAAHALQPEWRRYLDTIAQSARRMGTLIDDLLSFSRLARAPLAREPVDMRALAQEALRELPAGAATVDIRALPTVPGDPALLRQVWTNLLSNAVKYSSPRGAEARVEVCGAADSRGAVFEVSDNGVGFDMRYREKLFGVFQRLHGQDEFEGTGVGLAIVERIVRRHGGRVDARGVPGRGAVFRIELPMEAVADG